MYRDLTAAQLRDLLPEPLDGPRFFFVADDISLASAGHALLVVPVPYPEPEHAILSEEPRAEFRVAVAWLWAMENNLSLANADWADFATNVADDGVFRGVQMVVVPIDEGLGEHPDLGCEHREQMVTAAASVSTGALPVRGTLSAAGARTVHRYGAG